MSFVDHFDRLCIINLPQRTDRWRHVQRELDRIGVSLQPGRVERFEAIRPESADGFESVGRRGVFLSHYAIARQALRDGLKSIIVLEDDVAFTPAMLEHGETLARQLHQMPWHIALFGYLEIDAPAQRLRELLAGPPGWLPLPGPRIGSHFYALHRDVLPALVEYMAQVEMRPPGHPQAAETRCENPPAGLRGEPRFEAVEFLEPQFGRCRTPHGRQQHERDERDSADPEQHRENVDRAG